MTKLKVNKNRTSLETEGGKPFFYMADTAWELIHRLNREEVVFYLNDRARKGFNVIQTVVLAEINGLTVPNAYGSLPLENTNPEQPNEDYFQHVDYVLDKANELGLYVGLLPTWGKYWKDGDNLIFTEENAFHFGEFLGKRYECKNLIWILGGDQNIVSNKERNVIDSMAAGLKKGDSGNHLITFHPRGPGQSSRQVHESVWLDFNMIQSSHASRNHDTGVYIDYDRSLSPAKPTLDGEPRYETMPVSFYFDNHSRLDRFDSFDIRQASWWAAMSGVCGHTYGDNNIWQMWKPGLEPVISALVPWDKALDHPGARQMGLMRQFMEYVDFSNMIPDIEVIVDGPDRGGSKIRGMRAKDHSKYIAYSPYGETFTLDLSQFSGIRSKQTWFDPRYGIYHDFRFSKEDNDVQSFQTYTPPSKGRGQDWVLLIEETEIRGKKNMEFGE